MHIADIIWLPDILDKLAWKHHVSPEEVVEVLSTHALYRKVQKGIFLEKTCTLPVARPRRDGT